ncbi:hypothetical protein ACNFCJ_11430 [Pseudomonas sp. NY15364]|uniref:hypothetical protein n=1 Tax=unclassified Pseudomonas TaxID=196821 RepID=UPI000CB6A6C7|nr:hypothetical protein [Pseudomonas sp. YY-1]PKQ40639.1 hypothetical protein CXP40_14025 [Pseudomonas sp. YY-1]
MSKLHLTIFPTLGHTLEDIEPLSETLKQNSEAFEDMIKRAIAMPGAPVTGAIDNRTVVQMTYEETNQLEA